MFCKHCGKEISETARFCDGCGKPVLEEYAPVHQKAEVRRCPNCGESVNQYAQICRNCGQAMTSNVIAKKKKKKPLGCLVWAIVIFLILGSCSVILGGDSENEEVTPEATESTVEVSITETESSKKVVPLDEAASEAEKILQEHFADCVVSYDETGFTATITMGGISLIGSMAATGNEEMIGTWNKVVDSTVSMSNSMTRYFRECGYDDFTVTLNVVNDQNKDNIVVMTVNGSLVYDAVSDG